MREMELARDYFGKVKAGESTTEQEISYWNYKLYIRNQEKHDSRIKGLVEAIHKEELNNY